MHYPTDRITHTTAFVTPVVEHWLEREITQWVYPMKDRSDDPSHHEQMLLPRSYISLLRKKSKTIDMGITALVKSAVGFADKAEKAKGATSHSFIVKSNAMRRSAVEKKEELKALQAEIDRKSKELC